MKFCCCSSCFSHDAEYYGWWQSSFEKAHELSSSSSSAFPSCISGVHHFWVRFLCMWSFFNPTIEVVTFHLRGSLSSEIHYANMCDLDMKFCHKIEFCPSGNHSWPQNHWDTYQVTSILLWNEKKITQKLNCLVHFLEDLSTMDCFLRVGCRFSELLVYFSPFHGISLNFSWSEMIFLTDLKVYYL